MPTDPIPGEPLYDVLVVGAGFSGLYMLHRLRSMGLRALVLERGSAVGGTWYWNRYPGARCDVESVDYCYSFSDDLLREWTWAERYPPQQEILRYLEHVADRFDLKRDIRFGTTVTAASYHENAARWVLLTDDGHALQARFCVMATGNLSMTKPPDIPGLDRFEGEWFHTGHWPHRPVDLKNRRVAVVGTGSSGIQVITTIAPDVARIYVLQRTPNYSMPAWNRPLAPSELAATVAHYPARREACRESDAGIPLPSPTRKAVEVTAEERRRRYEEGWRRGGVPALSFAFTDMFTSEESNRYAQDFARGKIAALVEDPAVARRLWPVHHIGTKRTCVDTGYFETYNRSNVELIDLRRQPIDCISATGIRVGDRHIPLDVIVFAVGFDAITGALTAIDIQGRGGVPLRAKWSTGPRTLLGVQTAGFPNLFMVTGPGSPSVLSNMVISIEQHVDWIADCIAHLRRCGADTIEPTAEAEDRWTAQVDALAAATLYPQANSWYVGANIPGKPRTFSVYVGGCGAYRDECRRVVAEGYRGFRISRQDSAGGPPSPAAIRAAG